MLLTNCDSVLRGGSVGWLEKLCIKYHTKYVLHVTLTHPHHRQPTVHIVISSVSLLFLSNSNWCSSKAIFLLKRWSNDQFRSFSNHCRKNHSNRINFPDSLQILYGNKFGGIMIMIMMIMLPQEKFPYLLVQYQRDRIYWVV